MHSYTVHTVSVAYNSCQAGTVRVCGRKTHIAIYHYQIKMFEHYCPWNVNDVYLPV